MGIFDIFDVFPIRDCFVYRCNKLQLVMHCYNFDSQYWDYNSDDKRTLQILIDRTWIDHQVMYLVLKLI